MSKTPCQRLEALTAVRFGNLYIVPNGTFTGADFFLPMFCPYRDRSGDGADLQSLPLSKTPCQRLDALTAVGFGNLYVVPKGTWFTGGGTDFFLPIFCP